MARRSTARGSARSARTEGGCPLHDWRLFAPSRQRARRCANSCQIYGQVLNPFIWGGDLVKAGINPDDTTGWGAEGGRSNGTYKYIGGQTNNTVLTRSFVIGLRLGF